MEAVLKLVWEAMNSPAGITVAVAILGWLLARLYAAKPAWAVYEGTIISAVKFAEKEIPDTTPNKALARLDAALKYVLRVYEKLKGATAPPRLVAQLREGIQIIHNELEKAGTLK